MFSILIFYFLLLTIFFCYNFLISQWSAEVIDKEVCLYGQEI
nr:MAG TPA: hypothetical protein [Caudoviricetes sp.]